MNGHGFGLAFSEVSEPLDQWQQAVNYYSAQGYDAAQAMALATAGLPPGQAQGTPGEASVIATAKKKITLPVWQLALGALGIWFLFKR